LGEGTGKRSVRWPVSHSISREGKGEKREKSSIQNKKPCGSENEKFSHLIKSPLWLNLGEGKAGRGRKGAVRRGSTAHGIPGFLNNSCRYRALRRGEKEDPNKEKWEGRES